jgi:hypothetical protein
MRLWLWEGDTAMSDRFRFVGVFSRFSGMLNVFAIVILLPALCLAISTCKSSTTGIRPYNLNGQPQENPPADTEPVNPILAIDPSRIIELEGSFMVTIEENPANPFFFEHQNDQFIQDSGLSFAEDILSYSLYVRYDKTSGEEDIDFQMEMTFNNLVPGNPDSASAYLRPFYNLNEYHEEGYVDPRLVIYLWDLANEYEIGQSSLYGAPDDEAYKRATKRVKVMSYGNDLLPDPLVDGDGPYAIQTYYYLFDGEGTANDTEFVNKVLEVLEINGFKHDPFPDIDWENLVGYWEPY